jgi:hypothetical protein
MISHVSVSTARFNLHLHNALKILFTADLEERDDNVTVLELLMTYFVKRVLPDRFRELP